MDLDQEVCLCFHVTQRKLKNFIRLEKPRRASQLSECGGAGTGCGWCRRFLQHLFDEARNAEHGSEAEQSLEKMTKEEYARLRREYIADKK